VVNTDEEEIEPIDDNFRLKNSKTVVGSSHHHQSNPKFAALQQKKDDLNNSITSLFTS
jgi:hypothetical protein